MDVREQTLKGKMARVIEFYIHMVEKKYLTSAMIANEI